MMAADELYKGVALDPAVTAHRLVSLQTALITPALDRCLADAKNLCCFSGTQLKHSWKTSNDLSVLIGFDLAAEVKIALCPRFVEDFFNFLVRFVRFGRFS
jgi:hypothetical protein